MRSPSFASLRALSGLSFRVQVALTCRSNHALVNETTTLIVNTILDRREGPSSQPVPVALALPEGAVEDLAEAA